MNQSEIRLIDRITGRVGVVALIIFGLALTACTATVKAPITQQELGCSFLGSACGKLTPANNRESQMHYINPAAKWTQYNKIMIDPVTFWGGETSSLSGSDQQMLVNFFHQQLTGELGNKFEIVDAPGPGVMKLDVALLDASSATPGLRTISMLVPQARALSSVTYLATQRFPFVGTAKGAAKLSDSETGEVLAAVVEQRIGGGSASAAFQWRWGDAQRAITNWSQRLAEYLSSWTSGAATP